MSWSIDMSLYVYCVYNEIVRLNSILSIITTTIFHLVITDLL